MPHETRRFLMWVVITRAEDLSGRWVAHVLDLDVVTHGTSIRDAIRMAYEASVMTIEDDLNKERDPRDRGMRTPAETWELFHKNQALSQKASGADIDRLSDDKDVVWFAGQIEVMMSRHVPECDAVTVPLYLLADFAKHGPSSQRAHG